MSKNSDQTINKIIRLMETDESADAPADSIRWAKNIFLTRAAPKKSVARKIIAVLQMDLSPNRAAFGERSAASGQTRQMFFHAGENALDIRITNTEKGFDLRGQILGEDFAGGAVRLGDFEAEINSSGEFRLTGVPVGEYNLSAKNDETEITIENLNLS